METLLHSIQKCSSGKFVSILFILTMGIYVGMLSYTMPAVSVFAPDFLLFDSLPSGYSFNYAYELLDSLGVDGRNVYLTTQLPLDFIYPGLFSITYSLMLIWLYSKTLSRSFKAYYFALVPFLAGVFDYIENIFIIRMINSFPDLQLSTVKLASIFTVLKSSFTMVFFVLLLVGFILLLKKKLFKTP
ncbi:hypothetical protein OFY17_05100 [Marinomonas sp. C2222]|uniref:Uncharacterized protein n=1 Tax=Marinomonas sargassi TaxID=2984494 RepID=A0ABT2YQU3_9GAMM|nr:hypothetical protein [Marinomonas sargassi]MCV2402262.1 hypothetical protein [Marinomonas sargassi]